MWCEEKKRGYSGWGKKQIFRIRAKILVGKVRNGKAPSLGRVTSEIVKIFAENGKEECFYVTNKCLSKKECPKEWKRVVLGRK